MSQSLFNSTIDAIRLVEQYERDEALARQLQNSENPGQAQSSSRTGFGGNTRITTELPPINEGVIDLTGSDDEEDEDESTDISHNTAAESDASNAQIESLEARAWERRRPIQRTNAMNRRMMQEPVEHDTRPSTSRTDHQSGPQDNNSIGLRQAALQTATPGTSRQGPSVRIFRWNVDERRIEPFPSAPRRHQHNLASSRLLPPSVNSNSGACSATASSHNIIGLRQDQIKRLPSQSLDETLAGDTCPVCMDEMSTDNTVRRLPCLHVLHKGCIDPWLKKSKECPICKFDISSAM